MYTFKIKDTFRGTKDLFKGTNPIQSNPIQPNPIQSINDNGFARGFDQNKKRIRKTRTLGNFWMLNDFVIFLLSLHLEHVWNKKWKNFP